MTSRRIKGAGLWTVAMLTILSGCVAVVSGGSIEQVSATPATVGYEGGMVTVTATAEGSGQVVGSATYPGGDADAITFEPVADAPNQYQGRIAIRPNTTDRAVSVTLEVQLVSPDTSLAVDSEETTVTVSPAPSLPPDPPGI
ncbi:MAG: hypothetical protein GF320_16935 [Armatimonadia bacterium]|nr:hypothetical protein [Armatimonadia bacterium]